MKIYAVTIDRGVLASRDTLDWQNVYIDEHRLKQMALGYLQDITDGVKSMSGFKENLEYHASEFEWHLDRAMECVNIYYPLSAEVPDSETSIFNCKFKAVKLYQSEKIYYRKYIIEHCVDSGVGVILDEDYNYNYEEVISLREQAIEKIKKEILENKNNPFISYLGESLVGYISMYGGSAIINGVMVTGKSLQKCLEYMEDTAKAQKTSNTAMLTPAQSFQAIVRYYTDAPACDVIEETEEFGEDGESLSPEDASLTETFTRNAWYCDIVQDVYYEFSKGDIKPKEVLTKRWKTATKKDYLAYIDTLEIDDLDDIDLDDLDM